MYLQRLKINDIRNLVTVDIEPGPGLNVVWGANGSGKTSLLEAIHLLGMGRSFRTRKSRPLVRDGAQKGVIFGLVQVDADAYRLGISKPARGAGEVRIDGQRVQSAAQLARRLPLQLITPTSHALLEGGPKGRRAYIDWALFHVEHQFFELWQIYRRALQQRNYSLRQGNHRLASQWHPTLVKEGVQIDRLRRQFCSTVEGTVRRYVLELTQRDDISLEYRSGWNNDRTLEQALNEALDGDLRAGYTSVGPHRGDLLIRAGGHPAHDVLSRGQEKLLVCALKLAEADYLKQVARMRSVFLIDDLPSELDAPHRERLMAALRGLGAQVFVSTLEPAQVDPADWDEIKMFHVEHGRITPS